MARGWESKGVEAQIEEGQGRVKEPAKRLSPEERERELRLQSLKLSRTRLHAQLEVAKKGPYREVLLKGLSAIEQQIEELSPGSQSQ
ncbi:MAG TPA: hypothetical protein VMM84_05565 [Pyrinomonadaceae bacterium]|nr:hypothetical protein [Pyrinomonadaceae bacterium]